MKTNIWPDNQQAHTASPCYSFGSVSSGFSHFLLCLAVVLSGFHQACQHLAKATTQHEEWQTTQRLVEAHPSHTQQKIVDTLSPNDLSTAYCGGGHGSHKMKRVSEGYNQGCSNQTDWKTPKSWPELWDKQCTFEGFKPQQIIFKTFNFKNQLFLLIFTSGDKVLHYVQAILNKSWYYFLKSHNTIKIFINWNKQ